MPKLRSMPEFAASPQQAQSVCEDGQNVRLDIESNCGKISDLAEKLQAGGPVDAFQEISPASPSRIIDTAEASLSGCCKGCVVPIGLFKLMQVAAGLALPKDIDIKLTKD